jgi:signal transduction histidine kinase/ActR/RegA family two-component response regulator
MNTIHDDRMGSEAAHLRAALNRERRAHVLLGRAKDALEVVLGVGCVGFCRIRASRRRLIANAHFKAYFGWPPDALLEAGDLDERIHEADRAAFTRAITAALAQDAPLALTVRAVWPCGMVQHIALRGRWALADSSSGAAPRQRLANELVLVASNVTAEHQALQEQQALAAREAAGRARAAAAHRINLELLGQLSHQLRAPLNSILGWNRILAIKRGDDPEIKAITARIEHSGKAQLRTANDVRDLGHLGLGKLSIDPRPMKLATVAAVAIEAASAAAQAKNIAIAADFTAGPGEMHGDTERLHQAIANLLSNAVKFTPAGGKIRVWLRREGTDLELAVADTGRGIAPEFLPYVFDRVPPADPSLTSYAGDLGIGLALTRGIVTLHGGSIRVTSDGVDRGTMVVLRLPGRQAAASAGESIPALNSHAPRPLSGLGILVVDDEPDARAVIAELLRLEGADVAVSDSAASAYEQLSAKGARFDVVITDIGMPLEDGYSLVRKLRALRSGNRVLAVALTGLTSTQDAAAALAAGFDLHVAKPADLERIVPMIRRLTPQPGFTGSGFRE